MITVDSLEVLIKISNKIFSYIFWVTDSSFELELEDTKYFVVVKFRKSSDYKK
jgi:hypothetical protein